MVSTFQTISRIKASRRIYQLLHLNFELDLNCVGRDASCFSVKRDFYKLDIIVH
ncbi:MAG: hypothetical protein TECD_01174 [Hyphomicrobiaceae bacterium hypho_1]